MPAKKKTVSKKPKQSAKTAKLARVAKNLVVSIHYSLKDDRNKVLESSKGEEPLVYLHGHDQIIRGLEKALVGKSVGENFSVRVSPRDGYGEYNSELVSEVERAKFRSIRKLKVGSFFELGAENGEGIVVRVTKIDAKTVTLDGNHPFAGKKLSFDVKVVDIRAATKEELAHGHAHAGGHC